MRTRYKVVLQGFSEFERNALTFCLKLTGEREPAYEPVPRNTATDFVIADADQAGVIDTVVAAGLTRQTVFVGRSAPEGALSQVSRPIDPTLIVRELDQLLAASTAPAEPHLATQEAPPPVPEPEHTVDVIPPPWSDTARPYPLDFVDADIDEEPTVPSRLDNLRTLVVEPPPPEEPLAPPSPPPEPPPRATLLAPVAAEAPIAQPPAAIDPPAEVPASQDERALAKAAARAAARRARLAHATPAISPDHPPDALVLDDSEIAQVFLCRLLSDFGFRPHPVQSGAEALDLLAQQTFTVAFLDIQLDPQDEHDGIDLCHLIKHEPMSPDGSVPAVVVVSGQAKPADRVRAGLAGCDVFLSKPLSRGDVARALESCGVALPSDARRGL